MSNEMKCHVLVYGPPPAIMAFTDDFEREQFQAHVPIAADAQPQNECDPIYLSRILAEEHWGSRFIYPPGVSIFRGPSTTIESELQRIKQEGYERYRPPTADESVALITFTVPTDPPSRWADQVINRYYDRGLMFVLRWWDMENYHRCVACGALDGICLRAGAIWSVPGDDHAASWCGRTSCPCPESDAMGERLGGLPFGGLQPARAIGGNDLDDDDTIVAMTAFVDGPAVRIVSTWKTGKRTMIRSMTTPGDADSLVHRINSMNIAIDGFSAAT